MRRCIRARQIDRHPGKGRPVADGVSGIECHSFLI